MKVCLLVTGLVALTTACHQPIAPVPDAAPDLAPDLAPGPSVTSCLQPPSSQDLQTWMEQLTGQRPVQVDGQQVRLGERASELGRSQARAFLRDAYQSLGYTVADAAYPTGVNLVASRAASAAVDGLDGLDVVVVGAHYDTVPGTVGADDNASGLAVSLAIARSLGACTLGRQLRFVSFDEEEKGLVGSRAYVAGLRTAGEAASVQGMLNLDMMGYDQDDDGAVTIFDCDRPGDAFLVDLLLAQSRALPLALLPSRQCLSGGDHRPFWDARIPAVALGEPFGRDGSGGNPCYHQPCDQLDRLNLGYLARLAHLAAATVAVLTSAQ